MNPPMYGEVGEKGLGTRKACMASAVTLLSSIEIVANAEGEWVLENDYNIIQQLVKTLPMRYCIQLRYVY